MQTRGVNRGVRETPREDSEETEGTAGRLLELEILHTVGSDRHCHTVVFIRFEARHDDSSDGMLSKERNTGSHALCCSFNTVNHTDGGQHEAYGMNRMEWRMTLHATRTTWKGNISCPSRLGFEYMKYFSRLYTQAP